MAAEKAASDSVTVRFSGIAANIAGKDKHEMPIPEGATVRDLVDEMARLFGKDFAEVVMFKQGTSRELVTIYVNQQEVKRLEGLDTPLPAKSNVSVVFRSVPWVGG